MKTNEIIQKVTRGIREQIKESLWNCGDDFFNALLSELFVTISSYSKDGGMVINVRSCEDDSFEKSFSMIEILERSYEYECGNLSYDNTLTDLEILAQSFESLAANCRERLKSLEVEKG